ncbi:MAG: hypothetical protein KY392_00925 [Chloroflexi bacterium]|nr:hypothetical protein [Chloroflexota bacterium]
MTASTDAFAAIRGRAAGRPAVVLDDDPTGTQTVRDLFVLTEWDIDRIARRLTDPALFLSTNSRSLEEADAVDITRDAVRTALSAARQSGRPISLVSRSDSTLRGHFPAETLAIADAMGAPDARVLLVPFFGEGGRVTVDDVHLLDRDGIRTPVAETEFARDATFAYRSSNLRDWVAEKYAAGGYSLPGVESLAIDTVRTGADAVAGALRALPGGGVMIANAETDPDVEAIALGALRAEDDGLPLVARTAASYVRARAGQPSAPSLVRDELDVRGPGLIVVGSHVPTTTQQMDVLTAEHPELAVHELDIGAVLARDPRVTRRAAEALDEALGAGRTGIVATERHPRDIGLAGGKAVSRALVETVRHVRHRPAWVIAKGGITSYDVARHCLGMAEARIAGPLLTGVPVWISGSGGRWPGVPLVVFPGNVGSRDSLLEAYRRLSGGG